MHLLPVHRFMAYYVWSPVLYCTVVTAEPPSRSMARNVGNSRPQPPQHGLSARKTDTEVFHMQRLQRECQEWARHVAVQCTAVLHHNYSTTVDSPSQFISHIHEIRTDVRQQDGEQSSLISSCLIKNSFKAKKENLDKADPLPQKMLTTW